MSQALETRSAAVLDARDGRARKVWASQFGLRQRGVLPQLPDPHAHCQKGRSRWRRLTRSALSLGDHRRGIYRVLDRGAADAMQSR